MAVVKPIVDKSIMHSLYPLSLIADHLLDKLLEQVTTELPNAGKTILKRSEAHDDYHYLLEGEIEHRISFENRAVIACNDARCVNPLQELLKEGGSIKAGKNCNILSVNTACVDQFLSWSQSQEFKVVHMDDDLVSDLDDMIVDDNYEGDWSELFLKSQLAINIPAATMIQLFSAIEDVAMNDGDVVVKENSPGDYFYIIKKGFAKVLTSPRGPFAGASFDLSAGDYFGDEALVADTTRNATVVMAGAGVLGRLSKDQFNQIIKQPLMLTIDEEVLETLAESELCYLDVRLAAEYRHDHYQGSKNYPIAYIRKHLHSFDKAVTYVIAPGCGRRGELAVYLLKQAGYKVFLHQDINNKKEGDNH